MAVVGEALADELGGSTATFALLSMQRQVGR